MVTGTCTKKNFPWKKHSNPENSLEIVSPHPHSKRKKKRWTIQGRNKSLSALFSFWQNTNVNGINVFSKSWKTP